MIQGSFKGVQRGFQGSFKDVLRKFKGGLKKVSSVFQENLMKFCCAIFFAWISSQIPEQKEGLLTSGQMFKL